MNVKRVFISHPRKMPYILLCLLDRLLYTWQPSPCFYSQCSIETPFSRDPDFHIFFQSFHSELFPTYHCFLPKIIKPQIQDALSFLHYSLILSCVKSPFGSLLVTLKTEGTFCVQVLCVKIDVIFLHRTTTADIQITSLSLCL